MAVAKKFLILGAAFAMALSMAGTALASGHEAGQAACDALGGEFTYAAGNPGNTNSWNCWVTETDVVEGDPVDGTKTQVGRSDNWKFERTVEVTTTTTVTQYKWGTGGFEQQGQPDVTEETETRTYECIENPAGTHCTLIEDEASAS